MIFYKLWLYYIIKKIIIYIYIYEINKEIYTIFLANIIIVLLKNCFIEFF